MEEDVPLEPGDLAASFHQQVVRGPQHGLCLRLLSRIRNINEQVAFVDIFLDRNLTLTALQAFFTPKPARSQFT